jgi:sulfur carrier protein
MEIVINGRRQTLAENITVAELLQTLNLSGKPVAVEVNRELTPKQRHTEYRLSEGDVLEIVTLVGGG